MSVNEVHEMEDDNEDVISSVPNNSHPVINDDQI